MIFMEPNQIISEMYVIKITTSERCRSTVNFAVISLASYAQWSKSQFPVISPDSTILPEIYVIEIRHI